MRARLSRGWARVLSAGLIALPPLSAEAVIVLECGDLAPAEALIEPWEDTTRSFSNGAIRIAALDLGEPDCCPQHLAVLIPANMYGGRACFLVARNRLLPNGWVRVGIDEAEASRDGTPGLRVSVPVYSYDPTTGGADLASRRVIALRIRQAAGIVELEPAK